MFTEKNQHFLHSPNIQCFSPIYYLPAPTMTIFLLHNCLTRKIIAMKTIAKITLVILATFLIALNVSATGIEFNQEQYIDDIPFDLDSIEKQTRYDNAVVVDYSLDEEVFINDLPFNENQMENIRVHSIAMNQQFDFEEECYIDDIPVVVLKDNSETTNAIYAKAQ